MPVSVYDIHFFFINHTVSHLRSDSKVTLFDSSRTSSPTFARSTSINKAAITTKPTKQPMRKSIVGHPLSSPYYYNSNAWINTIKSIGVCWGIVAFIWIFFRVMSGATVLCRMWYIKRASNSSTVEMSLLHQLTTATTTAAARRTDCGTVVKGHHGNCIEDGPPPEYEQFLPPSYDQIMATNLAGMETEEIDELIVPQNESA